MLSYETAKKLKEKGMKWGTVDFFDMKGNEVQTENYPTLSELIEACGSNFVYLKKDMTGWLAIAEGQKEDSVGETPEEAVANLWLALNEK